jgi:hypothetical protein
VIASTFTITAPVSQLAQTYPEKFEAICSLPALGQAWVNPLLLLSSCHVYEHTAIVYDCKALIQQEVHAC